MAERDPFAELAGRARAEEASRSRRRERALAQQAAERATLAGTLVDLAEAGTSVALRTASGRTHRGSVVAVGRDYCSMAVPGGTVHVALDAVALIRPDHVVPAPASGDRPPPLDVTLAEALARLLSERPRVMLVVTGGEPLVGELAAVGIEVLTVVVSRSGAGVCYVSLDRLEEVFVPRTTG